MTRGGARRLREEPERRCIASGETGPTGRLIRFVLGPSGDLVPDLAGKLPGRGVWLTAERDLVGRAVKKRLFSRAFRTPVEAPDDLADRLEDLLARRLIDIIGLARKAGQAVTGFEKVRARLRDNTAGVLVEASDGAADGKTKLARLADAVPRGVPRIELLTAQELGLAFGRDFAIHAALDAGGFADRALMESDRLGGFRAPGPDVNETRDAMAPACGRRQEGPKAVPGQGDV